MAFGNVGASNRICGTPNPPKPYCGTPYSQDPRDKTKSSPTSLGPTIPTPPTSVQTPGTTSQGPWAGPISSGTSLP